jgi:AhpD family alkylhydroperoxidase
VMNAYWAFDWVAVADGGVPVKHKESIAVAVSLTTQCSYCFEIHAANEQGRRRVWENFNAPIAA